MLVRLIENWKEAFDTNQVIATMLMNLSCGFNTLPLNLLISKLCAYGFDINHVIT